MKNTKILVKLAFLIIALLLPVVVLLSILQIYSLDKNFYLNEYEKHNISAVTRISTEDLEKITVKVIDYLKDNEDNLNIQVPINGKMEEVFGEREKLHMIDVKVLFQNGYIIRNISLVLCGVAIVYLIAKSKKDLFRSLISAGAVSFLFVLSLFLMIQIDFNKYFTHFHEIFFTNDLWLLNPETDVLIQMLPLEFFINISVSVIGTFLAVMISVVGLSIYGLRSKKLHV